MVVGVDHRTLQLTFTLLLTLSGGICCAENASHTQAYFRVDIVVSSLGSTILWEVLMSIVGVVNLDTDKTMVHVWTQSMHMCDGMYFNLI